MMIEETQYPLHPEGKFSAAIPRVDEDVERNTRFGITKGVRVYFQTGHTGEDGKPLLIFITANRTIGKRSSLRAYIKQITGGEPGRRFDPQDLVGMQVLITVAHVERDGRTYANVVHIAPDRTVAATTPQKPTNQEIAA
jgi:hypothetical protein